MSKTEPEALQHSSVKNPRYSIVVCAYNVETYLRQALDSVLIQTDEYPFELVIVNDGSTDMTDTICLIYAQQHPDTITYIKQENRGLYEARKTGIRYARGEFIAFIDADDYWRDDCLKVLNENINQRPNCDVFLFLLTSKKTFGPSRITTLIYRRYVKQHGYADKRDWDISFLRTALLTTDRCNNLLSKCIRRSCFDASIAQTELLRLNMGEDKLHTAAILETAQSAYFINEILYYYRPSNSQSITRSFNMQNIRDLETVHQLLYPKLEAWNLPEIEPAFKAMFLHEVYWHLRICRKNEPNMKTRYQVYDELRHNERLANARDGHPLPKKERLVIHLLLNGNHLLLDKVLKFMDSLSEIRSHLH